MGPHQYAQYQPVAQGSARDLQQLLQHGCACLLCCSSAAVHNGMQTMTQGYQVAKYCSTSASRCTACQQASNLTCQPTRLPRPWQTQQLDHNKTITHCIPTATHCCTTVQPTDIDNITLQTSSGSLLQLMTGAADASSMAVKRCFSPSAVCPCALRASPKWYQPT